MDQSKIPPPVATTAAGYSLPYTLYLHSSAWLLRKLVALMSGTGDLFDKNLYVDTPGLGEGRVSLSICIPNGPSVSEDPKPLVLVTEGGGFVLGQPSDGEHVVRPLSDTVCFHLPDIKEPSLMKIARCSHHITRIRQVPPIPLPPRSPPAPRRPEMGPFPSWI